MLSHIERLRKAPLKQRRQFALTLTFIFVIIIAVVWVVSLGVRFSTSPTEEEQRRITPEESGIQSPYNQ